jgi:hypothetical protein
LTNKAVHGNFGTLKLKEAAEDKKAKQWRSDSPAFAGIFAGKNSGRTAVKLAWTAAFSDAHNQDPAPCNPS